MRSCSIKMYPKFNDRNPYKKGEIWRQTHSQGKAMWQWRQELARWSYRFRIPRRHQKLGRGKEGVSLSAFRGRGALLTRWFQSSSLQNCGMMSFCCFKSLGVCTSLRELEDTQVQPLKQCISLLWELSRALQWEHLCPPIHVLSEGNQHCAFSSLSSALLK